MSSNKTGKVIGKWVLDCLKHSILPFVMYITSSVVLFMFVFSEEMWHTGFTTARIWLCIVFALLPMIYQGLMAFLAGANGYEMLLTGNIKRTMSEDGELSMSSHKEHQEYRAWKGFALGSIVAIVTIVFAIIWGCNQDAINQVLAQPDWDTAAATNYGMLAFVVLSSLVWGWETLPFLFLNTSGVFASYFLMLLLAILPIVISGVCYIVGAYARRRKKLAKLEAEAKAAEEAAAKPKKINYGGLPGTKPNKRK